MNVYINLSVANLKRARTFFEGLGFAFEEAFCDETAIAMRINPGCMAMLLTAEKFAAFTPRSLVDAHQASEVLTALQLESRAAVDAMLEQAERLGGAEIRPQQDHDFMYARAFADPDGHIWEIFWFDPAALARNTEAAGMAAKSCSVLQQSGAR